MAKGEVMAMTDEALQIKAAELMGWENIVAHWYTNSELKGVYGNLPGYQLCSVPNYPNDISAAWELVEKAHLSLIRVPMDDEWRCGHMDGSHINDEYWWEMFYAKDSLAPRAITRAFIMAMDRQL